MKRRALLQAASAAMALTPGLVRAAGRTRLQACSLQRGDQGTKLRLSLSAPTQYHMFSLTGPQRLVIDLGQVAPALPPIAAIADGEPVNGIRAGVHGDSVRVVLDLTRPVAAQPRWQGGELLVDLGGEAAAKTGEAPEVSHVADALGHRLRPYVVAIDAGHGGKDPGAVSADARYEKHVAMAVAGRLHQRLASDARYRPTMIRSDDRFVPLHERVLIAHRHNADLFVSIHADAAPTRQARGASVFALSQTGASSALARWIADSENAADDMGDTARRLRVPSNPVLSQVLADLSLSGTIASSLAFGTLMLERLQQVTRLHQNQVGQAGFAVLKSPDIPSLLVETGFMSNRDDCSRLCSDTHQDELAQTLHAGIDDYFAAFPGRA
ncbi:N-acetylmuramoyl-L-alanine amidase [Xanthomonas citri pv. fuscans]|uniref:N-acetylmuramoyl-L-alanine amidase AmiC n=1 Tax=Xanthomonas citri pv. fuscans TaxID=366649 RepID=A0AB34Q2A8_XANCI|nr:MULTISPECIES: N-acetylmuramoyl-L-alanine amidase [Xanthomonas]ATS63807.1 N-acetylmuramoyl-L-alanine amidase [Xanthomonas citri pv. phaseoli var. fuscans]ATS71127.1 N-acetylmuramoyl-L-alanine amidase [Xanthomonas citri pv. phaseoli var. fuscans]ATS77707.1 N-acetylmuramoyl-L-alanine amidase [Xanthomonas citri pv. phaseoli var. fuscans]ATS80039.1 N-acetylmuramoyl-L-alanine amidase [Xanthomonas citri pv. phaseoli var. fuscans]ATS90520.1 N-acetylmuramoyl-L-alanine amidase [Xanthomonas citri pv. 